MYYSLGLLIFLIIHTECVSLNGQWTGYIKKSNLKFLATVPGGIYTDLQKAKLIPANLFGFNDVENRWVAYQNVDYVKHFSVDEEILRHPRVTIIFHGLDTFATIWINDKQIGDASNMFTRYSFDVKEHLKIGENKLNVSFQSPISVSNKLYKKQSKSYKIPPECVPPQYKGECHVNHIRKMQASYSWDWGPAFPSMGIWKDVELVPSGTTRMTETATYIHNKNSTWQIETIVSFDSSIDSNIDVDFESTIQTNTELFRTVSTRSLRGQPGRLVNVSVYLEIPKDSVSLWWPNGHGSQPLYNFTLNVKWTETQTRSLRLGFRTVELVQEPLQKGLSFYFKINGIPIFAKGTNWIPSNILPEHSYNEKTLTHLLTSCKAANMNMVRVWGGGLYESKRFYELADELGLMTWQDFMFVCAMYPTTEDFLASVGVEIEQNIKRLSHHPSIVLWAGNNENEAALYGNWYGTGTDEIYKTDYDRLYVDKIEGWMKLLDRTRPFVVSSPSNGLYAEQIGRFKLNPQSSHYGDVHYYNYVRDGWDVNQYPTVRFSSEYGFQSLPFYSTLKEVAPMEIEDLKITSEFMQHRQHHPAGDIFIRMAIEKNFNMPKSANNSNAEFDNYIYLSQINQAVTYKVESEHYRQMMSTLNLVGEGRTMGALYWQLNDVWQAPSWSSIDFSGRWKMVHYYAKDFFAPVIVSPRLSEAREVQIFVISDLSVDIHSASLGIKVYNLASFQPVVVNYLTNLTIAKRESRIVTSFWLDEFLEKNTNCGNLMTAKQNCIVELELLNEQNHKIAPLNYVYTNFKNVTPRKEHFEIHLDTVDCRNFKLTINSDTLSLFVWLETGIMKGHFSENGFHMTSNKKKIHFLAKKSTNLSELASSLRVRTLYSVYNDEPSLKIVHSSNSSIC